MDLATNEFSFPATAAYGAHVEKEYLYKEKASNVPRHGRHNRKYRGDFFFKDHRRSSLYRTCDIAVSTLTEGYSSIFSLHKYSTEVRVCETPAFANQIGIHQ